MWRLAYIVALVAGLSALAGGCARPSDYLSPPVALAETAQVRGHPAVRFWGDAPPAAYRAMLAREKATLGRKYLARNKTGSEPVAHYLALSGGAEDGAFGAGLLVGWGTRGDRPSFDLVTGISSGALIAPFAYLGKAYDKPLAELFVEHSGGEIFRANLLAGLLGGNSLADNEPLANLIATYVDQPFLRAIAEERRKGRILLVGTTNLNAQRPVYWDMGRIAQQGTQQALALFRQVLLASTAVPGIFPPVHIEVTANGRTYHEMHVDGGPTRAVFLAPSSFSFTEIDAAIGKSVERRLWVIRNAKVNPEYAEVRETVAAIASRSLETLTKNQGIGDLLRIYESAVADGIDYNLAAVPPDFTMPRPQPFNRDYMRALYDRGFADGRKGYRWMKAPPGVRVEAAVR